MKCDICNQSHHLTTIPNDGIRVCERCLFEHYKGCEICGYWYRADSKDLIKDGDHYICKDCDKKTS